MRLLKNSVIYSVSTFVQKGLVFLLLPLYTQYMSPAQYGVVTVILATSFICSIFFTLGLDSAIIRFYYDYKDSKLDHFREFFGTLLTALVFISIVNFVLLVTALSPVVQYFIEDIPLDPYGYIGFSILIFQPLYNLSLAFLQAKNEAGNYTFVSFVYFFLNVAFTLLFLIGFRWEATGYLLAILIAQAVSSVVGIIIIRKDFVVTFKPQLLKKALEYSFPLIPHSLASQTSSYADRIILNKMLDSTRAGIYHLGYVLSIPVEVMTYSINRAYTPLFFERIEGSEEQRSSIINAGLITTLVYFMVSAALSCFAFEIVYLFFRADFLEAHKVVPFVSFAFANVGLYYLFSTILFYDKRLTKFVPVCTVISGVVTIALNLLLIPRLGLYGSGLALFTGQLILAITTYMFSLKSNLIRWPIGKIVTVYCMSVMTAILVFHFIPADGFSFTIVLVKTVWLVLLFFIASYVYWAGPFYLLRTFRSTFETTFNFKNK